MDKIAEERKKKKNVKKWKGRNTEKSNLKPLRQSRYLHKGFLKLYGVGFSWKSWWVFSWSRNPSILQAPKIRHSLKRPANSSCSKPLLNTLSPKNFGNTNKWQIYWPMYSFYYSAPTYFGIVIILKGLTTRFH
jgi:hypothetical protein